MAGRGSAVPQPVSGVRIRSPQPLLPPAGARLGWAVPAVLARAGRGAGEARERRGASAEGERGSESCSSNSGAVSDCWSHGVSPKPSAAHADIPRAGQAGLHCFIMDTAEQSRGPLFQSVSPRTNFKYASRHCLLFIDFALTTETTLVLAHRNTGPVQYCQHMLCRKRL